MSGAQVHRHGAAINALIVGTKRWFLFPPWSPNWGPDAFGMKVSEWAEKVLPSLRRDGLGPVELVQHRGATVYVPPEWGHAVLNYGDVVGVSSQVFVDLPRELEHLIARLRRTAEAHEPPHAAGAAAPQEVVMAEEEEKEEEDDDDDEYGEEPGLQLQGSLGSQF